MKLKTIFYEAPTAELLNVRTECGFALSGVVVGGDVAPEEDDIDWK